MGTSKCSFVAIYGDMLGLIQIAAVTKELLFCIWTMYSQKINTFFMNSCIHSCTHCSH